MGGVARVAAINNHPSHVLGHWVTGCACAADKMAAAIRGYVSNVIKHEKKLTATLTIIRKPVEDHFEHND